MERYSKILNWLNKQERYDADLTQTASNRVRDRVARWPSLKRLYAGSNPVGRTQGFDDKTAV